MKELLKPLEPVEEKREKRIDPKLIGGAFLIVLLGIGSGWGLTKLVNRGQSVSGTQLSVEEGEKLKVGQTYGQTAEVFKDKVLGVIEKGGINGEGTHKILREGGESQTAYLTSSVLDLDLFVGRKVEVWGETFAAQKAGWLLDVGAIKVLE